ncbi:MAG: 3-oxoacyl-ACP synthase [Oscillospiraceae bacterium]|nr:3-oxoacyl-ACP synthase [Oscillospiraceae bacterium]
MDCGITGFGFAFPETIRDYNEISARSGIPAEVVRDKLGIRQVYYPGGGEQPSGLAIRAAENCLANTGICASSIDLVIYFGENYADHIIYNIAAKTQEAIGARNAWSYNLDVKCGGAVVAMEQAKLYMQSSPDINTVLLVAGYRNVDRVDYGDVSLSFLFGLSAGGAACILQKGHGSRRLLGTATVVDGSFVDSIVIPAGGTKQPVTHENINDPDLHSFRLAEPEAFRERLDRVTIPNLVLVQEKALAKCGKNLGDLDFVCAIHMNVKNHRMLFDLLKMPLTKGTYLADYGHVGQLDPLIALGLVERQGLAKKGDLIGVLAMGFGYVWNGAVIEW